MKKYLQSLVKKYNAECDYVEIRLEDTKGLSIVAKGRNIDTLDFAMERGGCVRALVRGGWGFSSFNNLENVEKHLKMAIKQASLIGKATSRLAPAPVIQDHVALNVEVDPRSISLEEKLGLLKGYNELVLGYPGVTTSSIRYLDRYTELTFVNSEGTAISQEMVDMGMNITPIVSRGGQSQMLGVGAGSTHSFNALRGKEEEIKDACKRAVALIDAPKAKSGKYTIICDRRLSGTFVHEAFGHTSEGEKVCNDERFAQIMKLGRRIGKPILNIFDTGLELGARGSMVYDDEGVKTEKTYLVKDGLLVGRLHTRETAAIMGEKPTGNARALNYSYPPIPRMRNTCIESGEHTLEDMIKETKFGIYCCDSYGGQTGEQFTFTAGYGVMIRDGRLEEMVRDLTIIGNLFDTMDNIDMIANDRGPQDSTGGCGKGIQYPLPVSSWSASFRVNNVIVGGQ
ncbi:TldD/PmbA family protein [bacterium]|nr:TldD/PmbA family protein [bacterium]